MKKLLLVLIACFVFAINAFAAVNINTASQAELETIKGIGPAKAKAIVEYRKKNGNFKSVDDLDKVHGFGKKTVDKMRKDINVGNATAAAAGKPAKTVKTDKPKTVGNETAAVAGKTADAKTVKVDTKKDAVVVKKDEKKK